MEWIVRIAWALLALVHVPPAAVLIRPALTEQLYGVSASGETGVLLIHRGALFLAVAGLAVFAALDPASRKAAGFALTVSMIGFLLLYVRAGAPAGSLRTIAIMDAIALIPLALVLFDAWRPDRS